MPDGKNKRYKKPKVGKNVSGSKSYKKQASEKKSTKKKPGETGGFRFGRPKVKKEVIDERSTALENADTVKKKYGVAKNEKQFRQSIVKSTKPDETKTTVTKGTATLKSVDKPKGGRNLPKMKKLKYTRNNK